MPAPQSPSPVTTNFATRYSADGYVFPVDVLSPDEASAAQRELESLEHRAGDSRLGNRAQLNYPHVVFRFAYRLVCHPRILDVVEEIIGPDILVWGGTFLIKEPRTESFISWHQDLRYWGLDSDAQVSAWLALSSVAGEIGCMRFVPGSHHGELLPHIDTFARRTL